MMDILQGLFGGLRYVPDWVGFFTPILLLTVASLLPAMRRLRRFGRLAVLFGGLGVCLLAGKGSAVVCAFTGFYAAVAMLLFPLARRRRRVRALQLENREGEPLRPAKVCCYDEEEKASPAQCGMRLRHAEEMLGNLKKADLSASDRLETEILSRTVSALSEKELSTPELTELNDCLASALKLTAKYHL